MWDFEVWDIYHPPSLTELKQLSARHPYQPVSALLREQVGNFKEQIYEHIDSILNYRKMNSRKGEDIRSQDSEH